MSYGREYELEYGYSASEAMAEERAGFIRRTYGHLAGAVLAFIGIEAALLSIPGIETKVFGLLATSPYSWLIVLGLFMVVSIGAQYMAQQRASVGVQYLGLGLYVVLEALILLPLLILAKRYDPTIIPAAGILTGALFAGLTLTVFITRKDFSFLGPILTIGSLLAFGFIIVAIVFGGITLGKFFCLALIVLLAGFILYQTSKVLHTFPTDMHVAAALMLFASLATLFWYVLQLLLILSSRE
jgi:FtsH-binding integral membrane protein